MINAEGCKVQKVGSTNLDFLWAGRLKIHTAFKVFLLTKGHMHHSSHNKVRNELVQHIFMTIDDQLLGDFTYDGLTLNVQEQSKDLGT